MPIYSNFDDKFNAALASKLKYQEAQGGAATTGANAQMLNAQANAGQVGDLNYMRRTEADAQMANAGTNRGTLAASLPMGLNANQVGSFGLRNFNMSPAATANTFSDTMYGTGGKLGANAQPYADWSDQYHKWSTAPGGPHGPAPAYPGSADASAPAAVQPGGTTTPALAPTNAPTAIGSKTAPGMYGASTSPYDPKLRQFARGGQVGDVADDTGADTRKVMARPGEYFLNPETVQHGFGGGNYEHGVRNLDEIVRRSTGNEPGATYSKKGKAGYARSGAAPANPYARYANVLYRGGDETPAGAAYPEYRNVLSGGMRDYTPVTPVATPAAAAGGGTGPGPAQWNAQNARPDAPANMSPGQWNAHVASLRTGAGGYPMLARGGRVPSGLRMARGGRVPGFAGSGVNWTWGAGGPPPGYVPPMADPTAGVAGSAAPGSWTAPPIADPTAEGIGSAAPGSWTSADQPSRFARLRSAVSGPNAMQLRVPSVGEVVQTVKKVLPTAGNVVRSAGVGALVDAGARGAYGALSTPTEDYAKRMGVTPGEPGIVGGAKNLAIRTGGALSDIGAAAINTLMLPSNITQHGFNADQWDDWRNRFADVAETKKWDDVRTARQARDKQEMASVADRPLQSEGGPAPTTAAAPTGLRQPDLREGMMLRAMALGGGGPAADAEQKNLLSYLGTTDTLRQQYQLSALQAQREHEKQIEDTLTNHPAFMTQTTDDKGNVKSAPDLAARARFDTELANRVDPVTHQRMSVYDMSRPQRDSVIADWKARDKVDQRAKGAMSNSSWYPDQAVPQRTSQYTLRPGSLKLEDVINNPNIHTSDWLSSFLGGTRNQVAKRMVYNPATGKEEEQLFPAAKLLGDQPGQVDVDSRYALGK